jgi:hypothetical protein
MATTPEYKSKHAPNYEGQYAEQFDGAYETVSRYKAARKKNRPAWLTATKTYRQ